MTPTISIVMPVYNVEKYLRECLDSVRAQTFTDWECICVDDGSTDASPAILDEYASKDSRFRVFRREHSNAGAVRNFGMTKATGAYLAFLDSDDIFSPWMFETLLSKALDVDADIVGCWFTRFCDGAALPDFQRPECIEWEDRTPDSDWSMSPSRLSTMPWNKIIRRTFIDRYELRFLEQTCSNDITFELLALSLSGKSIQTNTSLVAYRGRKGSIQSQKSKNPDNTLRAIDAYCTEMTKRKSFSTISRTGMGKIVEYLSKVIMWELQSQTNWSGYMRLYKGIKAFDSKWAEFTHQIPAPSGGPLARYASVVNGGLKERLLSIFEAVFSPILGNNHRQNGFSRHLSRKINRIRHIVFESKRLPWK